MTKLTKAQLSLLKKAATAPGGVIRPFGPEWATVYALSKAQLMHIETGTTASITLLGRAALSQGDTKP